LEYDIMNETLAEDSFWFRLYLRDFICVQSSALWDMITCSVELEKLTLDQHNTTQKQLLNLSQALQCSRHLLTDISLCPIEARFKPLWRLRYELRHRLDPLLDSWTILPPIDFSDAVTLCCNKQLVASSDFGSWNRICPTQPGPSCPQCNQLYEPLFDMSLRTMTVRCPAGARVAGAKLFDTKGFIMETVFVKDEEELVQYARLLDGDWLSKH
jgi:hypothetical protein